MVFTVELLRRYCAASLANAVELHAEATLLFSHGRFARAYFLSIASIEETGKAYLAFDGQGRRFENADVALQLRRALEDHPRKIYSAFIPWLSGSRDLRASVMKATGLMGDLRQGREPSMYTDLVDEEGSVQSPRDVVRERAAADCTRLAEQCLLHAQRYICDNKPAQRSVAEDQLYALKTEQIRKITNSEDFWWFYLARVESGSRDWSEAVVVYREKYVLPGVRFKAADAGNA